MTDRDDLLIEIRTEELPPKALHELGQAFRKDIGTALGKTNLDFKSIVSFATPRRLAVIVEQLTAVQPDQSIERKGPAIKAAYDAEGKPTKACQGFARSLGIDVQDLIRIKTSQGEWVGYQQHVKGRHIKDILPGLLEEVVLALPSNKRMRWGDTTFNFVRPIHGLILLFGDQIIDATVFGVASGRTTLGHRMLSEGAITIPHALAYETLLATEGAVIASFDKRREIIATEAETKIHQEFEQAHLAVSDTLLNEVTGLVEWPVILVGKFDGRYLNLPKEVLVSAMESHQRYFPIYDADEKLLAKFVIVSNLQTNDASYIIHGNERVLRARLADAEFFYETDKKIKLAERVAKLNGMLFQAKLGTLYQKSTRLKQLAVQLADKLQANVEQAECAAWLAKADLVTDMVNEFPELQGVMGEYYAHHDGEDKHVGIALREQYLPRYSGDMLPTTPVGQILAICDRLDLLVGVFGVGELPTGDKDPFGLRRAALGILRILIEKKLALDVKELIAMTERCYDFELPNKNVTQDILIFMQERLRAWYLEQGVTPDVFAAVSALHLTKPYDIDARIKAVQAFKKLKEAETLSIANKRVSNILAKYEEKIAANNINPKFFENESESRLAKQLEIKADTLQNYSQTGNYEGALLSLAELRGPIDDFFDHVMVMTDDKAKRENRILLLSKLRALFMQVADIALLQ